MWKNRWIPKSATDNLLKKYERYVNEFPKMKQWIHFIEF